jgi:hypothetical protein
MISPMPDFEPLTKKIIACAIEVHNASRLSTRGSPSAASSSWISLSAGVLSWN